MNCALLPAMAMPPATGSPRSRPRSERAARARRGVTRAALAAIAFACLPQGAVAQSFPVKPIRLVVPFAPGGAVDIVARAIAQEMTTRLGQPVVVENRTGSGGNIAAEHVIRSAPDGYTLLMGSPSNAVNATLFRKLPFNPATDYTHIGLVGAVPNVMLAGPAMPARNFNEFLALARAQPGMINYGSAGAGTSEHLAAVMLASAVNIQMVHVPYKGGAAAMTDLRGGQIPIMFSNLSGALPAIKAGHLRAFALASQTRSPAIADVPTFAELGIPSLVISVWWGVLGPAGIAAPTVARINAAINDGLTSGAMKQRLEAMSAQALPGTPEQFATFFANELKTWGETVKRSGATAD